VPSGSPKCGGRGSLGTLPRMVTHVHARALEDISIRSWQQKLNVCLQIN